MTPAAVSRVVSANACKTVEIMAEKGKKDAGGRGFSNPLMQEVWIETIHKELRFQKKNTEFIVNPGKLNMVTDKITNGTRPPMDLTTATVAQIAELEKDLRIEDALRGKMRKHDMTPADKYEFPLTDAQEVGWYHRAEFVKKDPWFQGRNGSEVTKYADVYVATQGTIAMRMEL
jgi:hypothetical protein